MKIEFLGQLLLDDPDIVLGRDDEEVVEDEEVEDDDELMVVCADVV